VSDHETLVESLRAIAESPSSFSLGEIQRQVERAAEALAPQRPKREKFDCPGQLTVDDCLERVEP
jgi:hypothetical protein